MDKNICKNCRHFKQHYTFSEDRCHWVDCGHCLKRNGKSRKLWSKGCESFEQREEEAALITKRFLSKRLLEYVLSLGLPPEITDEPPEEERLEEVKNVSD